MATINGTPGADALIGTAGADTISGFAGPDFLAGGAGNDVLKGGNGQDIMKGGEGADTMIGGRGSDTFDFTEITARPDLAVTNIHDDFGPNGFGVDKGYNFGPEDSWDFGGWQNMSVSYDAPHKLWDVKDGRGFDIALIDMAANNEGLNHGLTHLPNGDWLFH